MASGICWGVGWGPRCAGLMVCNSIKATLVESQMKDCFQYSSVPLNFHKLEEPEINNKKQKNTRPKSTPDTYI